MIRNDLKIDCPECGAVPNQYHDELCFCGVCDELHELTERIHQLEKENEKLKVRLACWEIYSR